MTCLIQLSDCKTQIKKLIWAGAKTMELVDDDWGNYFFALTSWGFCGTNLHMEWNKKSCLRTRNSEQTTQATTKY